MSVCSPGALRFPLQLVVMSVSDEEAAAVLPPAEVVAYGPEGLEEEAPRLLR